MGNEDMEKLALICAAAKGIYTTEQVAWQLGVNERTVRNLKKRYMEQGKDALVHGNSGKQPANYIEEDLRMRIIDLRKSAAYSEGSVTRFRDLLDEREGINIPYTSLWGILKAAGIATNIRARDKTGAFMFKGAFGEMLGLAAHSHDWFGDGTPCVLYGLAHEHTVIRQHVGKRDCGGVLDFLGCNHFHRDRAFLQAPGGRVFRKDKPFRLP